MVERFRRLIVVELGVIITHLCNRICSLKLTHFPQIISLCGVWSCWGCLIECDYSVKRPCTSIRDTGYRLITESCDKEEMRADSAVTWTVGNHSGWIPAQLLTSRGCRFSFEPLRSSPNTAWSQASWSGEAPTRWKKHWSLVLGG